jgi:protein-L-isoaspartate O-methyltransferase
MPHRQARTLTVAQRGELVAEVDPERPSGRILRQADMDASYIDLADEKHLEFDYMRWLRIIIRAIGAQRVLHIGGGACALARALAAEAPDSRQEVCEIDADVLDLARKHLGLRRAPGLHVRHMDGRTYLSRQPDRSWDAIIVDAFIGARVPERLITVEALSDAARVAPITAVNVVDNRGAKDVTAAAAGMGSAYSRVWTLGHRPGNKLVIGDHAVSGPDLARIAAQAAADPSPARLTPPAALGRSIAGIPPSHDAAVAEPDRA